MNHRYSRLLLLAASAVLFAACAKAPEQAVTAARDALTAARDAEADQYVSELYVVAADSFAAAEAEIETQNARNAFTRNYDRADALLAFATETAQIALTRVADEKEAVRVANEALFVETDAVLARVATLMTQAPVGKDGNLALASIREDATLAGASLEEARAAQVEGDFVRAGAIASAALEKGQSLAAELETAIVASGRRPRG